MKLELFQQLNTDIQYTYINLRFTNNAVFTNTVIRQLRQFEATSTRCIRYAYSAIVCTTSFAATQ